MMLKWYSIKQNWYFVHFNDECYFDFDFQNKIKIIKKSDQRYCQSCIQEKNPKDEKISLKNQKRQHIWTAIGHDFKSKLVFYDANNVNNKMTQKFYCDDILKLHVLSWLKQAWKNFIDSFVLKENNDSEHDFDKKKNIVKIWKKRNDFKHYFNCFQFFDFVFIENGWQASKQNLRKILTWNDETIKEIIIKK